MEQWSAYGHSGGNRTVRDVMSVGLWGNHVFGFKDLNINRIVRTSGSRKGTQAGNISISQGSHRFQLGHAQSRCKEGTQLGIEAKGYMDAGL